MKLKLSKILIFALILTFYASLVMYKIPLPAAEDLPRQMKNGEEILRGDFRSLTQNLYSYTQPEHYFANHHWLYGVFVYLLHGAVGWSGMVIFKIIFILLTFALLFCLAIRKADFWLVAMASVPAIFLLAGRSALRPELFGYFFVALYVYMLLRLEEHPDSRAIYWLVPAQIIWANIHITFPIGVMIVGAVLAEKIILSPSKSFLGKFSLSGFKDLLKNRVIKKLSVLIVVLSIVSFVNPLGIKGVIYSLTANIGSNSPVKSSEVQPISSTIDDLPKGASIPLALVSPIIFLTALSFVVGFRRKQIFYFLAFIGSAALAFYVLRGGPFLGIFFLLAFTANLNPLFLRAKDWINQRWTARTFSFDLTLNILTILTLVGFMTLNYSNFLYGREVGIGLERNAEDSAKFFIKNHLKGPILNDTDIGSYLIYYLYPKEKVYTDNRFGDAYTDDFFKHDYAAAVTNEDRWREVMDKYQFNTIFMYQHDQGYNMRDFMYRRMRDPNWVFVYGDRFSIILVRNIPENKRVIDKFAINIDNAQKRFADLTEFYDGYNQVAAADLFALMGYPDRAMANYEVAVALHPEWAKIWFVMGKMELQRADSENSNPALALLLLEQAIDRGWKTPNSYSFLALAYYRLGQLDKAEEAVRKELEINPKSIDAKVWLDTFVKARAARLQE